MNKPKPRRPLWDGPGREGPLGGVTKTLLEKYLIDKERFRIYVVEGLKAADRFNHRLHYGQMWHTCEEALASAPPGTAAAKVRRWEIDLQIYTAKLLTKYPLQQDEVGHWYAVCRTQFPYYIRHWQDHPDVKDRTPLLQEQVFDVPYRLPSGRVVRLRGKWDAVDLIGRSDDAGIWLFETKTKGDVRPDQIRRQLLFDLQTMMYLVALTSKDNPEFLAPIGTCGYPILGVRYNVIRRPLSGGKGSIVRHKATKNQPEESRDSFYRRVGSYIAGEPDTYFWRWQVAVTKSDIEKFRRECLDPVLENLADDYEWWVWCAAGRGPEWVKDDPYDYLLRARFFPDHRLRHYRFPYGISAPSDVGLPPDLDEFLASSSEAGLVRAATIFPELEDKDGATSPDHSTVLGGR